MNNYEKDSLMIFGLGLLALLFGFGMGVGSSSLTGDLFQDTWRIVEDESAAHMPNDYQITLASLQALGDPRAGLYVASSVESPQETVLVRRVDDIGIVTVSVFVPGTSKAFSDALAALTGINGLVIDLRDNWGGAMEEAVAVADLFVDYGILAIEQHRTDEIIHRAEKGEIDLPVVVLVNRDSYSAAEVVALALQRYGSIIVGQPSYGKATLQRTFAVKEYTLQLTTGYWYGPRGESVAGQGVIPNVTTEVGHELQTAFELLSQPKP